MCKIGDLNSSALGVRCSLLMFPRRRKSAGEVDSATAITSNRDVSKMASGQWILLLCSLLASGYEARSNRLDDVFYSEVRDLLSQRLPQEVNTSPPRTLMISHRPTSAPSFPASLCSPKMHNSQFTVI